MILYKYLDEDGFKKTMENNSVLLTTPSEFNDPFDCIFYVSEKEKNRAFKTFINYQFFKALYEESVINNKELIIGKANTKLLKTNLIEATKRIKKNKRFKWMAYFALFYEFSKIITGKNDEEWRKEFDLFVDKELEKIRHSILVSCFSLSNDSILMWSHYAKSHTGACIEWEINSNDFKEVKYSSKPYCFQLNKLFEIIFGHEFANSEIDYGDDSFLFAVEPIFNKLRIWKYENEVRCCFSINKQSNNIFIGKKSNGEEAYFLHMPSPIKAVYFGIKSSDDFLNNVHEKHPNIKINKMNRAYSGCNLIAQSNK